ncbi:hypothetical protein HDU87_000527 [Geranomyces variabilis]|uniref:2'-phosphotransferase n=1 Tax=Geranomyces variabilis TaxID=109894 RepID=A0AAD5TC79_9FUNG|nr:hypothetical protein HDU87_000527 [Geranomyces variabilis]
MSSYASAAAAGASSSSSSASRPTTSSARGGGGNLRGRGRGGHSGGTTRTAPTAVPTSSPFSNNNASVHSPRAPPPQSQAPRNEGGAGRGRRNRNDDPPDVQLSKALSYILRHGAEKDGIPIRSDGNVLLSDLKRHPRLRTATFDDIKRIVATNAKQRFSLSQDGTSGAWQIRANQGHSLSSAIIQIPMQPILDANSIPAAIHGTTRAAYTLIKSSGGLRPMGRQHIHLATGIPSKDASVISGMRTSAQVLIYVSMARALAAGIEFWRSENGVVLTSGLEGVLGCEFFEKVVDRDGRPI